jgi:hypothetical protein
MPENEVSLTSAGHLAMASCPLHLEKPATECYCVVYQTQNCNKKAMVPRHIKSKSADPSVGTYPCVAKRQFL